MKFTRGSVNEAGAEVSPPLPEGCFLTPFTKPAHSQQRSVDRTTFYAPGESGEDWRETLPAAFCNASQRKPSTSQLGHKWPGPVPAKSVRFMMLPGLTEKLRTPKKIQNNYMKLSTPEKHKMSS